MSAYIVLSYDLVDIQKYIQYAAGVKPLLDKHGAKVIVAGHDRVALEGEPATHQVVIEFGSEAQAMAWYNDPDYQPLIELRQAASKNGTAFFSKRFVPPGA